jgi:hypothetical protein
VPSFTIQQTAAACPEGALSRRHPKLQRVTPASPPSFNVVDAINGQVTLYPLKDVEPKERSEVQRPQEWGNQACEDVQIGICHLAEAPPWEHLPVEGREPCQHNPALLLHVSHVDPNNACLSGLFDRDARKQMAHRYPDMCGPAL